MTLQNNNRPLFFSAILAGISIISMTIISLLTGASQEFFEQARTSEEVKNFFNIHPLALNAEGILFSIDGLFAILYMGSFIWLSQYLVEKLGKIVSYLAAGLFIAVGILDLIENYHIQSMLTQFTMTGNYPTDESHSQFVLSSIKFHFSYIAAFFYGLGFFRLGGFMRLIGLTLWFVFIPFGLIVQNTIIIPETISPIIRALFFIGAFAAIAYFAQLKRKEEAL